MSLRNDWPLVSILPVAILRQSWNFSAAADLPAEFWDAIFSRNIYLGRGAHRVFYTLPGIDGKKYQKDA